MKPGDQRSGPARRVLRILLGVLVGVLLLALLALYLNRFVDHRRAVSFDPERWRSDSSGCAFFAHSPRRAMAGELSRLLVGQRAEKAKVERLLGKPELVRNERLWSYHAGTSTMDCLSFDIRFDTQGRVNSADLVQH